MLSKLAYAAGLALLGASAIPASAKAQNKFFYIGEVRFMATNFCPRPNWRPADGSLLPISQFLPLFSLLGARFGGDGKTNFALPKLESLATQVPGEKVIACIAIYGVFPER